MNLKEFFDPDRMAKSIRKQREMWFENLGVSVNLNRVLADYAKTLGKEVSELTEFEKHEAVCKKFLEEKEES